MAAVSVLGPGGYPREPYGSFAGKPASAGRSGHFSVLGPGGYPKELYGSFAGKPPSGSKIQPLCSVLGPGGYPRPPYGSFTGKPGSGAGVTVHDHPFLANVGRLINIP